MIRCLKSCRRTRELVRTHIQFESLLRFACIHFFDASHSLNFDHRRRPETLRVAMATAFF